VRIAKLRNRIQIQRVTATADNSGGLTRTWANYVKLWAEVKAENAGREDQSGDRRQSDARYGFTIRANSAITTEMRVIWQSRAYSIIDIQPIDARTSSLRCALSEESIT
jgi:SPP1 family predicted phage head-tail adaptor